LTLDNSKKNQTKFLNENAIKKLSVNEKELLIMLLEMQKFSMFMFTSCGWFFAEISGIETVKILEYAARAMELAKDVSGIELEDEFLKRLAEAKSNLLKYSNGKDVYLQLVKPAHITV
jgi:hypothetical protein